MWIMKKKGYRLIAIREGGKRKLMLEHRHIMEQTMGRKLDRAEVVHHINGDRLDNRLENLKIMDHREHSRFHYDPKTHRGYARGHLAWNKGLKEFGRGTCAVCGATFFREMKQIRHSLRRNRRLVCSKTCRARSATLKR